MWFYPEELVTALASLGLAPQPTTPPSLVRDAISGLYRYELRRIRQVLLRGEVEKSGYHALVVGLRKKDRMLTLPLPAWERICRQPD